MKLTKNQANALYKIGSSPRTNLADLGPTGVTLIARGLLRKDWRRNDAAGESLVLTQAGRESLQEILGATTNK